MNKLYLELAAQKRRVAVLENQNRRTGEQLKLALEKWRDILYKLNETITDKKEKQETGVLNDDIQPIKSGMVYEA